MIKQALGLIETIGLATAIEAADAAVKSANVRLIGYELTKGDGMVTIKVEGDVGAVKAAIDSARAAASKVGTVVSTDVIPRPAQGLEKIVCTAETVGCTKNADSASPLVVAPEMPKPAIYKEETRAAQPEVSPLPPQPVQAEAPLEETPVEAAPATDETVEAANDAGEEQAEEGANTSPQTGGGKKKRRG